MTSVFLYDRDCGFCEWSAEKLRQIADVAVKPAPLEDHALYRSGSHEEKGHRAIGSALAHHGRNVPVRFAGKVLLFPPLTPLFAGIYWLVAKNRHKLGPLVGKDSCSI